jgi:hypothetical protein
VVLAKWDSILCFIKMCVWGETVDIWTQLKFMMFEVMGNGFLYHGFSLRSICQGTKVDPKLSDYCTQILIV